MGRLMARPARRRVRRARRQAVHSAVLRRYHRTFRLPLLRYALGGDLLTMLTAPVVYSAILPFVLVDVWVSIYQAICFRAWGLVPVRRRAYFAIDRHKLAYLNGLEKVTCLYCSYANGTIAFIREVVARTEQYWCPIRHARRIRHPHDRYAAFIPYGDAAGYRAGLPARRAALKK